MLLMTLRQAPPPREDDDEDDPEVYTCDLDYVALPKGVEGGLVQISCGSSHGAALTCDGRVVTWGSSRDGRLGRVPFLPCAAMA